MNGKKYAERIARWGLAGGLTLATVIGTFSSHKEDFPPLYTRKVGNDYGISLSLALESEVDSKFYGVNLAFLNAGNVNGINLGVFNLGAKSISRVNGLEIGLFNLESNPERKKVNGVQIGLINHQTGGDVVQIGVYNASTKNEVTKNSFLINYDFR